MPKILHSDLDDWMRKTKTTTNALTKLVGCSRQVIWKVKKGMSVCPLYARKISEVTGGKINPPSERKGRPW